MKLLSLVWSTMTFENSISVLKHCINELSEECE